MSHHIIEADHVGYFYPDGHNALKEISFTIHHGESVGIIGANGAGKSTLLMLLSGIIFPSQGEVRIGSNKVTKQLLPVIRQRLGMVFQDPDDQLFMPTVYEDIAFGPRNFGLSEPDVDACVVKALNAAGILHLKDRSTLKLSAGEKRSAAVAAALAMNPDMLIFDEPTSFLDPKSRRRLIHLLDAFTHTKIITSHDLDMIWELCHRTIILNKGTVAADGLTTELLRDQSLLDSCGLELPLGLQSCIDNGKSAGTK